MDDASRKEVAGARNRLNLSVQLISWSALSLVWIAWTWWVLPLAIAALFFTYRFAVQAAGGYGELVKSSFDIYNRTLLEKTGLLKEKDMFVPYERGRSLTMFVKRGKRPPTPDKDAEVESVAQAGRKFLGLLLRPPSDAGD
jgi:hypothetical protein